MDKLVAPSAHMSVAMMPRSFTGNGSQFGVVVAEVGPPIIPSDVALYTLEDAAKLLGVRLPLKTPDSDAVLPKVVEWNPTNSQMAYIMALRGNSDQKEAARAFFKHHLDF